MVSSNMCSSVSIKALLVFIVVCLSVISQSDAIAIGKRDMQSLHHLILQNHDLSPSVPHVSTTADLIHAQEPPFDATIAPSFNNNLMNGGEEEMDELDTLYFWFTEHDLSADGKLDGNELLHAFLHSHNHHSHSHSNTLHSHSKTQDGYETLENMSKRQLRKLVTKASGMVDAVLKSSDMDRDGYLSLHEFLRSQNH